MPHNYNIKKTHMYVFMLLIISSNSSQIIYEYNQLKAKSVNTNKQVMLPVKFWCFYWLPDLICDIF